MNSSPPIHIGAIVKRSWQKSGITASAFAQRIGHARQNFNQIMGRDTMDTGLLFRISETLGEDFFQQYSQRLSFHAGDAATELDQLQQEKQRLEQELAAARTEIGYLKEIVSLLKSRP